LFHLSFVPIPEAIGRQRADGDLPKPTLGQGVYEDRAAHAWKFPQANGAQSALELPGFDRGH